MRSGVGEGGAQRACFSACQRQKATDCLFGVCVVGRATAGPSDTQLVFFLSSYNIYSYIIINPRHLLVGSFKSSTRRRRSSTWCWARWTRAGRRRAKSGRWRWPCPGAADGAAAVGTAARSAAVPSASPPPPAPPPAAHPARPTRSRRRCSCCCTASRRRHRRCSRPRLQARATTDFDFSGGENAI